MRTPSEVAALFEQAKQRPSSLLINARVLVLLEAGDVEGALAVITPCTPKLSDDYHESENHYIQPTALAAAILTAQPSSAKHVPVEKPVIEELKPQPFFQLDQSLLDVFLYIFKQAILGHTVPDATLRYLFDMSQATLLIAFDELINYLVETHTTSNINERTFANGLDSLRECAWQSLALLAVLQSDRESFVRFTKDYASDFEEIVSWPNRPDLTWLALARLANVHGLEVGAEALDWPKSTEALILQA